MRVRFSLDEYESQDVVSLRKFGYSGNFYAGTKLNICCRLEGFGPPQCLKRRQCRSALLDASAVD